MLFASLFRGREDVFARRWEKNGKIGYAPAYDIDWTAFNEHKRRGGTWLNFKEKIPISLTPDIIKKHFLGAQTIGIYPLLEDNTSWFIAADFDGEHWWVDCQKFVRVCSEYDIPVSVERSRSGNGCHVWLFFDMPYPAFKSRRIFLELIRQAFHLSEFDKEVSFDRLFPNQDELSGKNFGNLIALPFQGRLTDQGKTAFIHPETGDPYPGQWQYLLGVKRLTTIELDTLYGRLVQGGTVVSMNSTVSGASGDITITLASSIELSRCELDTETVKFLKEELNFMNAEYLQKKRFGKSTYQTEKYFKLIDQQGDILRLPRGFLESLKQHFDQRGIRYHLSDRRTAVESVQTNSAIELRAEQKDLVEKAMLHDEGTIVAPPGSGKTIVALELIARHGLPALILVHRRQLMSQWIERIQSFLQIPKAKIGRIDGVKKKFGKEITVAMLQSFSGMENQRDEMAKIGTVIIDECHHVPAKTFREVVKNLNVRYLYGLTATPTRKHHDEKMIFLYVGNIIAELAANQAINEDSILTQTPTNVVIRKTDLDIPFKFKIDNYQLLAKMLSCDHSRNKMIVKDILAQTKQNRKILVLSERKEHLEILNLYLRKEVEMITITGDDSESSRKQKLKQIETGHYQVILSTGQFFGEGLDIKGIDCLVVAFPFSFDGKLAQYVGRLRGADKLVLDYQDHLTRFLDRQFKQRMRFYKKQGYEIREA
ncbi:DEAD/DEAH box helicase [Patescibacteria group bacterium]|nr:DEAD/DEAH box helicase [Patescibacteria group bacterium]